MLNIDKNSVDFLVTENMVAEVEVLLTRDFPRIHKIVDEMISRGIDRMYFVACGSPLCAARTAKYLADRYSTLAVEAISGWEFVDNTPARLDAESAVIAVSDYGKTEEVLKAVELGKAKGAMTVAITKKADSPLAKLCDYVVDYNADCIWEMHTLCSYEFVIDYIQKALPSEEIAKIREDIKRLPPLIEHIVTTYEEKGRELGEKASKWPFVYTVAAGPLRPLAYKEGVVTLMEFVWTHGGVLDAGEFRHGPLEIVEKGVPFIFIVGTDDSRHTTLRALDFVKRYTDDVIVFDMADFAPDIHPWLAPMVLFVPMEWFCYYMSIYKDHNPDDRRYYGGLVEY